MSFYSLVPTFKLGYTPDGWTLTVRKKKLLIYFRSGSYQIRPPIERKEFKIYGKRYKKTYLLSIFQKHYFLAKQQDNSRTTTDELWRHCRQFPDKNEMCHVSLVRRKCANSPDKQNQLNECLWIDNEPGKEITKL